jgi:hypothetical protein
MTPSNDGASLLISGAPYAEAMVRPPRLVRPGLPCHVTQRGNRREARQLSKLAP